MQYCTKCKNTCPDAVTVCPSCKRSRALRQAKDDDMVYFMKTSEYEASEFDKIFTDNGIEFEVKPFSLGLVSSLYDSEIMPTDKNIFVKYSHLENAKVLTEKDIEETDEEEIKAEPKHLITQIVSVLAFLILVTLVVLGTDALTEFIRGLI